MTKQPRAYLTGPTYLTISRIVLAVLFFIFVLIPETWSYLVALVLFIVAAITDKLDGQWARQKNLVTDLGAFLDPLADKILTSLAFLALVYLGVVPIWAFALILVRDFAVDGMRMMAARTGVTIAASFYGKLKTTTQMIALVILLFNLIVQVPLLANLGDILLYLSLILSLFSGADYLIKGFNSVIKKPH